MPLSDFNNIHILAPNFIDEVQKNNYLSRENFIDQTIESQLITKIKMREPILFLPNWLDNFYTTGLLLVGVLESGAKASVLLKNVPHFFEIFPYKIIANRENEAEKYDEFLDALIALKGDYEIIRSETINRKIFNLGMEYYKGLRIFFKTDKARRAALRKFYTIPLFFITSNYSMQQNAVFAIFDKYCGFWMQLQNYDQLGKSFRAPTKAKHNFTLNFSDYVMVPEELQPAVYVNPGHNLKFTLDIETCEVKEEDSDTIIEDEDDIITTDIINSRNEIFNICISVSDTACAGKELLSIGLFRPNCQNYVRLNNNKFNIMCKSQKEMLLCMGHIFAQLQPDFLITYNGNGFDLPVILLQARLCGIFDHLYCLTSILSMDDIENLKNYNPKYKCYANSGGYTNWSKIHTSYVVSGIPTQCKEVKGPRELKEFKLEAEKKLYYHYWCPPGCINIDMYLIAKKSYPKAKRLKLNDVLKLKKIPVRKDDMTYEELWRIWRASRNIMDDESLLEAITRIDKYCRQDCHCTDLLECGFMLITQKRSMCKYTCLPLNVTILQADGIKVVTGITRLCHREEFTAIAQFIKRFDYGENTEHLRYHNVPQKAPNQGAIVDIYKRGKIHVQHEKYGNVIMPVEAIDAASLYPNSMIANNLSPECIVYQKPRDPENYIEHYLPDLPQSIIDEFGIVGNKIWIRNHEYNPKKFGIIPKFLAELFDDRKKVKRKMAEYQNIQNELADDFKNNNPKSKFAAEKGLEGLELDKAYDAFFDENIDSRYHECEALKKTYDAEQYTIKILMNTVYGCAKYEKNAIYCYIVAHITTKFGREIITKANEVVKSLGCELCYNDTDSVYFYHPVSKYEDILAQENCDRKKKMVQRSMKLSFGRARLFQWYCDKYFKLIGEKPRYVNVASDYEKMLESTKNTPRIHKRILELPKEGFNDIVNRKLAEYTGGNRIEFVREETLCPAVFATKKKYFGHKHEWSYEEELTEGKLLIRGIAYVTRNASEFLKTFNKTIMLEILASPEVDVENIIFTKMQNMYLHNYSIEKYAKYFTYKPGVRNETMNTFVNRMKLLHNSNPALYRLPNPLEVVPLVLTKPVVYCNLNGSKKTLKKGELFEYIEVIKHKNATIDRDAHLQSLYSSCSQLLTYKEYPEFYKPELTVKEYKQLIEKKYVKPYFDRIIAMHPDNIKISLKSNLTKELLKGEQRRITLYLLDKYTAAFDILTILANYSGAKTPYNYLMARVDKLCTQKCKTIMSEMHFNMLSKMPLVIPSLNDTDALGAMLDEYGLFINHIYDVMESRICNELFAAHSRGAALDYSALELFNEREIEILTEFRRNVAIYVYSYQYHVEYAKNADIIPGF